MQSRLLGSLAIVGCLVAADAGRVVAQEVTDGQSVVKVPTLTVPPPVVTLNQDRLFKDSAFGRAVLARAADEAKMLAAENRRIEDALEKEERDLTERRATMNAADFATITAAFDVKVEEIRAAQDGKSRAITRQLDEDRQRFFQAATSVLGDVLAETGAVAILADSAIILSLTALDVTPLAITRMDQALPASAAAPAPAQPEPQPQPDPAPQSSP
ncbi:MAG: OmpH family outer membrane protein [Paracoccaceae bacterium]